MEEAVRVMQLKPLMRTAIRLVKGLEINQTADRFDLAVFSIISWFKANTPPPPSPLCTQWLLLVSSQSGSGDVGCVCGRGGGGPLAKLMAICGVLFRVNGGVD